MLFLADEQGRLPKVIPDLTGDLTTVGYLCGCVAEVEGNGKVEGEPGEVVWKLPCDEHIEVIEPLVMTGTK